MPNSFKWRPEWGYLLRQWHVQCRCCAVHLQYCLAGVLDNSCMYVCVNMQRDCSLTARCARGKPRHNLKAFGTSAGFTTTRG